MVSSFISSGLSNLETWKKTVEECVDTFGWTCCIYHLVTFVFWFPFQVIILDHSNIFIFIWIFFFSFHAAKEAAEGFWWTCSIYGWRAFQPRAFQLGQFNPDYSTPGVSGIIQLWIIQLRIIQPRIIQPRIITINWIHSIHSLHKTSWDLVTLHNEV